jgi:polyketide synthase PksN
MKREGLIEAIKKLIAEETGIPKNEINESDTFFNLGFDSVSCIFLMDKLEKELKIELNPIHFWDYPSIDTYSEFLIQEYLSKHGS